KVFFDLPTSVNEDFAQALRTYLVIQTTESWMFWYGLLEAYKLREGHCRVPDKYLEDGFRLGQWVGIQRGNEATISDERRQKLDELEFIWDAREAAWEEGFSYLKIYKDRNGHCQVPVNHKENRFGLGRWVDRQRQTKEIMPAERRRRLDE